MLRPFFSFFGGKWRCAPNLYAAPQHPILVEPFAGSAGYSLRYPDRRVLLFDKDPVICEVWRYLIGATESEILNLPDLRQGQQVNDLPVPSEAKNLIGFWLNKACASPCNKPSKWMRSGFHPSQYWGSAIRHRIASQLKAIRHWRIIHSGFELADCGRATYFVDPPYVFAGNRYRCSSRDIDYPALARWCQSLRGQVMVCENEGADWLAFGRPQKIKGQGSRGSQEVVWLNDGRSQGRRL